MPESISLLAFTSDDGLAAAIAAATGRACAVSRCVSRQALFDHLADGRFDLVALDANDLGGSRDFVDMLAALTPATTAVVVCDADDEAVALAAVEAGIDDYVFRDRLGRVRHLVAASGNGRRRGADDARQKLRRAHAALLQLARSQAFHGENLIDDLREITEVAARAMDVGRAGVWLYDGAKSRIRCIDLFDTETGRHTDGEELRFGDHPAYFLALGEQRLLVAHDALTDRRTSSYRDSYLVPRDITAMLDAAVRSRGELVGVICLEHRHGPRRWTLEEEVFACAFADLVSLALESSERQAAEQALARSESRFREVYRSTTDGILFVEALSGRRYSLEGMNPAAERLLGLVGANNVGRLAEDVFPPEIVEHLRRVFSLAADGASPVSSEQQWPLRAGPRWFEVLVIPARHEGHPVHRLSVVLRDVTERKHFEETLCRREEMFRRLVETTNVVPWEADVYTSRFTYVGPQVFERFGYPLSAWYEDGFRLAAIHPDDRDAAAAAFMAGSLSSREYSFEYRMMTASGEPRWVRDLVTVVVDPSGRPALRGFLVDVTESHRAEEEIRRLNAQLEKRVADRTAQLAAANKELESFSYSVSHDLRAPLRAIDGFSRAVLEDYEDGLDESGRDMLRRIRAAAKRMGELIDDLLHLSRINRGELKRKKVSLSDIARECAAALLRDEPGRQVSLTVADGLEAFADRALMRLVFDNLLGNALKYTSKRESARIEVGEAGGEFFVRDDGAGFDPAYAAKLFVPFSRLHRAEEFEGHGIGLATVARVIHRHRGEIRSEGRPGAGATFFFRLPQGED